MVTKVTQTPAKAADKAPTAPTENTPVESKAAEASRIAPLNLAALKPVKVAAPVRGEGAGRTARDNTIVEGWLTDLWQTRKEGAKVSDGLAIQIPASAYPEMRSRLNQAAAKLNLGVSVSPTVKPKDLKDDDVIELSFAVKNRKQNKPKSSTPSAETVAAVTGQTPAEAGK